MTERTHWKEFVDTNYIGTWDFKRDPKTGQRKKYTLEILSVERYKPARPRTTRCAACGGNRTGCASCTRGRVVDPNKRVCIKFKGARKPWLAGPVSLSAIASMFGPTVQDWIGKRLTLYADDTITMGRKVVGGVRCEPVPGQGAPEEMPEEPIDEEAAQRIADAFSDEGTEVGQ